MFGAPAGTDVTWLLPLLEAQLQRRVILLGPTLLGDPTGHRYRIHHLHPQQNLHAQLADATLTTPPGESLLVLTDTGTLLPQLTRPGMPEVLFALEDQHTVLTSYHPNPSPALPEERTVAEWHAFELARTFFHHRHPEANEMPLPTFGADTPAPLTLAAAQLLADRDLITFTGEGVRVTDRAALLTFATRDYGAAGGLSTFWEHPGSTTAQLVALLTTNAVLVSGPAAVHRHLATDGADEELSPEPRELVAYAHAPVDLQSYGFRPAPATRATVELVWPADPTIHRTAAASLGWDGLVDPVLALADTIRTTTHTNLQEQLRTRLLHGHDPHPARSDRAAAQTRFAAESDSGWNAAPSRTSGWRAHGRDTTGLNGGGV